jgi:hypothetical protein
MSKGLRWFFFVIGVGALIACGIYLGTARGDGIAGWRMLRALMFLLLGLFFTLMYGENKSGEGPQSEGQ